MAKRPSAARMGYDARWRRLRAAFLAQHPTCAHCGAHAVDVDHIKPKVQGGSDHPSNLRPLCRSCHARRTRACQTGRDARGCDEHGMPLDPEHPWRKGR